MDSHYEELPFTVTNTGGEAATATVAVRGQEMGRFNQVEAQIEVDEPVDNGEGATPTLDAKVQSALDNFVTTALIHDLITFTQLTDAGSERKVAQANVTGPVLTGRQQRIYLSAGSAAGSYTWTGKVRLFWRYA